MSSKAEQQIKKIKIPTFKIGSRRFKKWFYRTTGYDALTNPVLSVNAQWFDENIYRIDTPTTFVSWLQHQDDFFFTQNDVQASDKLQDFLSAQARITIIQKAHTSFADQVTYPNGVTCDKNMHSIWYFNPSQKNEWPREHIYTYPTTPSVIAEINQTSYIGRFTHIPNILRAWTLTQDRSLIENLINQIEDFEAENPINQGPQWSNISDIATRNAMFCLAYSHLYKSEFATPHTILLLLRQIAACTRYLVHHVENFDYQLGSSAFTTVACSVYYSAAILPWLKQAKNWHKTSHRWLFQAIENQFLPDGGYASGSLIEEKCALQSLTWVYAIAIKRHDTLLAQRISNVCDKSFQLFMHVCDHQTGHFPHIGHHQFDDFPSLSTSSISDIRPLLSTIGYIANTQRQYRSGPWDETLYWLFGLNASRQKCYPSVIENQKSFTHSGLQTAHTAHSMLIFRSGNIQHYKHQHADQMHIDYWHYGHNILIDSGSASPYTALEDKYFFNADAHNSITINGHSLYHTDDFGHISHIPDISTIKTTTLENVTCHFAAQHNGFSSLFKGMTHKRLVMMIEEDVMVIIDHIKHPQYQDNDKDKNTIETHWIMQRLPYQNLGASVILSDEEMPDFAIKWQTAAPHTSAFYPATSRGQARAWQNTAEEDKKPVHKLEIKTKIQGINSYLVTCFGKADLLPQQIDLDSENASLTCDNKSYDLTDFLKA